MVKAAKHANVRIVYTRSRWSSTDGRVTRVSNYMPLNVQGARESCMSCNTRVISATALLTCGALNNFAAMYLFGADGEAQRCRTRSLIQAVAQQFAKFDHAWYSCDREENGPTCVRKGRLRARDDRCRWFQRVFRHILYFCSRGSCSKHAPP